LKLLIQLNTAVVAMCLGMLVDRFYDWTVKANENVADLVEYLKSMVTLNDQIKRRSKERDGWITATYGRYV